MYRLGAINTAGCCNQKIGVLQPKMWCCNLFCNVFCNLYCNVAASTCPGMNIFTLLKSDWHTTATNPASTRTLYRWSVETPVLVGHTDLTALLAVLRRATSSEATGPLNALLHHATTDPLARRVLLEAFTPCLANRVARRRLSGDDLADYATEILTGLLRGIDRAATSGPHGFPATMIRRSIDQADRDWNVRHNRLPELLPIIDDATPGNVLLAPLEGDGLRPTRADRLMATLVAAVQAGVVTVEDASFVARSIVNGEPARIEAARRCYTERALQKRLQRTVTVLARHHQTLAA